MKNIRASSNQIPSWTELDGQAEICQLQSPSIQSRQGQPGNCHGQKHRAQACSDSACRPRPPYRKFCTSSEAAAAWADAFEMHAHELRALISRWRILARNMPTDSAALRDGHGKSLSAGNARTERFPASGHACVKGRASLTL